MAQSDINKNSSNFDELLQEKKLPTLLSTRELAAYLHKSLRWIQIELLAGRLPKSLKLGRSRYWIAEDVATWLKSGSVPCLR